MRRVHEAGFPRPKSLADFDFNANTAINPATINTLAGCGWISKGQSLCLIGDSGTGKSHLLIGLGTAAAEQGHRVRYVLAAKLVNELVEAADQRQLSRTITRYGRVDLLCLDLCRARDYAEDRVGGAAIRLWRWAFRSWGSCSCRHSYRPSRKASILSVGW